MMHTSWLDKIRATCDPFMTVQHRPGVVHPEASLVRRVKVRVTISVGPSSKSKTCVERGPLASTRRLWARTKSWTLNHRGWFIKHPSRLGRRAPRFISPRARSLGAPRPHSRRPSVADLSRLPVDASLAGVNPIPPCPTCPTCPLCDQDLPTSCISTAIGSKGR